MIVFIIGLFIGANIGFITAVIIAAGKIADMQEHLEDEWKQKK